MLELHDSNGMLGSNDNWRATQEEEIIGTTVPPADDREAAIVAVINPGNYTAIVRGKDDTTGVAVVEVYDVGTASLDASSNAKLAQISTRGTVLSDDNVMIGGFIISGDIKGYRPRDWAVLKRRSVWGVVRYASGTAQWLRVSRCGKRRLAEHPGASDQRYHRPTDG